MAWARNFWIRLFVTCCSVGIFIIRRLLRRTTSRKSVSSLLLAEDKANMFRNFEGYWSGQADWAARFIGKEQLNRYPFIRFVPSSHDSSESILSQLQCCAEVQNHRTLSELFEICEWNQRLLKSISQKGSRDFRISISTCKDEYDQQTYIGASLAGKHDFPPLKARLYQVSTYFF